jgi:hypothetical protein
MPFLPCSVLVFLISTCSPMFSLSIPDLCLFPFHDQPQCPQFVLCSSCNLICLSIPKSTCTPPKIILYVLSPSVPSHDLPWCSDLQLPSSMISLSVPISTGSPPSINSEPSFSCVSSHDRPQSLHLLMCASYYCPHSPWCKWAYDTNPSSHKHMYSYGYNYSSLQMTCLIFSQIRLCE